MQTPFPLGFNDNISRSHCIRKQGNDKRKRCGAIKFNTSFNDLTGKLRVHGRHSMLSYSPAENKFDLELSSKVFFLTESRSVDIAFEESE